MKKKSEKWPKALCDLPLVIFFSSQVIFKFDFATPREVPSFHQQFKKNHEIAYSAIEKFMCVQSINFDSSSEV